ncbi:MAG: hypothetical protein ABIK44_03925, partial [candidate division WOR-3 bacterium]
MRQLLIVPWALALLFCEAAKGPVISIDRSALASVKRLALLPTQNTTAYQKATTLIDHVWLEELLRLERFEFVEPQAVESAMTELGLNTADLGNPFKVKTLAEKVGADAVVGLIITSYVPFTQDQVLGERKEVVATELPPQPKGILEILVPDKVSTSKTEYEYKTVTTQPALGAVAFVIEASGRPIYNASKFISASSRIP